MGDDSSLVSVVLPFYNAPHLNEAIESVLAQSYSNFELLLVDNGSTDHSKSLAEKYACDQRVKLLNEPKRGVVHAANKGMSFANGNYIARMDADDIAYPERLELQVRELDSNPHIGMVSGMVDYHGEETNEGFRLYVDWVNTICSSEQIQLNQFVELPLVNPSIMFRKALLEQFGGYEEGDFPEDYEWFLRLLREGVGMCKVKKTVIKWRILQIA